MEVFCRYETDGKINYGRVEGEKIFTLDREPWHGGRETGSVVSHDRVNLLFPTEPGVIIGLGGAYSENWEGKVPPGSVRWFIRPPGAAASWNEDIILPFSLDEVKVEVELVIVIGKKVKDAGEDEAQNAIFGYTVGNDVVGTTDAYYRKLDEKPVSEENLLPAGLKVCDRFAPCGPFIHCNIDWRNRERRLKITDRSGNVRVVYENNTSGLLYSPGKIVSDMSKVLTLSPGDLIMTGTTRAFSAFPEEVVEVSIEGMGVLINRIVARDNATIIPRETE
jgi:2-keto-4-pentenoate hydratase/2-oxohepta-3-ene-1,7-dioic acid hydratase in catechol pathway